MPASSREFAAALAPRLGEVAPENVSVFAEGSDVVVATDTERVGAAGAAAILDDADECSPTERIETAARAVLSSVQDYIVDEIRRPWPSDSSDTALPDVQVSGNTLCMWFGDTTGPTILLEPIEMGDKQ